VQYYYKRFFEILELMLSHPGALLLGKLYYFDSFISSRITKHTVFARGQ